MSLPLSVRGSLEQFLEESLLVKVCIPNAFAFSTEKTVAFAYSYLK